MQNKKLKLKMNNQLVRKLRFSSIVHLTSIYKQIVSILSCLSDSAQGRRGSYFQAQALCLSLRTC